MVAEVEEVAVDNWYLLDVRHLWPKRALAEAVSVMVEVLASSFLEGVSIAHHSPPSVSTSGDDLLPQNLQSFPVAALGGQTSHRQRQPSQEAHEGDSLPNGCNPT